MSPRPAAPLGSRRVGVLHVVGTATGGVARVTLGQVRDQVDRGWGVALACPSYGDLGYAAREAGASVTWWDAPSLAGRVTGLRAALGAVAPDVVHLHGARAGAAGRLVVRDRLPTVYQPHTWPFLAPRRRSALRWERYAARWTTELLCASEAERTAAATRGITGPSTVLPQGVDLARYRPAGLRDRVAARKALGLEDVPTLLCVGSLTVSKGQQDLLVDWPHVRRRVPEAQLVLVGDGPDRAALERLAASLDGVTLVGGRSDVPTWLAAADVVVVPSRWEGTALVPLEAMACARSVVATDIGGVAEALPRDAGALVPAGDGPALVEAVVRRLLDPDSTDEEGWAGRSHAERRHDLAASTRELSRVYLRLVGARRSRRDVGRLSA